VHTNICRHSYQGYNPWHTVYYPSSFKDFFITVFKWVKNILFLFLNLKSKYLIHTGLISPTNARCFFALTGWAHSVWQMVNKFGKKCDNLSLKFWSVICWWNWTVIFVPNSVRQYLFAQRTQFGEVSRWSPNVEIN